MDRRISYKVVLDTETCPIDKSITEVSGWNMFTYDIGWAIVDKRGKVYRTRSFVVADIFLNEKDLMQSAYYFNKVPTYWERIKNGETELKTFYNIRKTLLDDMAEFECTEVFGHNMKRFDLATLNQTQRWLSKSKYRYFFPYGTEIKDTLHMAQSVIAKMPTYKRFCKENGFMTKNNRVRVNAETLYKFIKRDMDFEEVHMGLDDVMIEKEILAYCYKQHKAMKF